MSVAAESAADFRLVLLRPAGVELESATSSRSPSGAGQPQPKQWAARSGQLHDRRRSHHCGVSLMSSCPPLLREVGTPRCMRHARGSAGGRPRLMTSGPASRLGLPANLAAVGVFHGLGPALG